MRSVWRYRAQGEESFRSAGERLRNAAALRRCSNAAHGSRLLGPFPLLPITSPVRLEAACTGISAFITSECLDSALAPGLP